MKRNLAPMRTAGAVSAERGNPELVRGCRPDAPRRLRALGPTNGEYVAVVECSGATGSQPQRSRAVGDPRLPDDEASPLFEGFALGDVSVPTDSASCESEICLVNHFQGRASCPYGQVEERPVTMVDRLPGAMSR